MCCNCQASRLAKSLAHLVEGVGDLGELLVAADPLGHVADGREHVLQPPFTAFGAVATERGLGMAYRMGLGGHLGPHRGSHWLSLAVLRSGRGVGFFYHGRNS